MIINRFQVFQAKEVAELIKRNLLEITSKYYYYSAKSRMMVEK